MIRSPSTFVARSVQQLAAPLHPAHWCTNSELLNIRHHREERNSFVKNHSNSTRSFIDPERGLHVQKADVYKYPIEREEAWERADHSLTSSFFHLWSVGVLLFAARHLFSSCNVPVPSSPFVAIVGIACFPLVYARAARQELVEKFDRLSARKRR